MKSERQGDAVKRTRKMEFSRRPMMRARWAATLCAALAVLVGVAAPNVAPAQDDSTVEVTLMVSLASDEEGPIDPRAKKIDARLKREFRYQGLKVIESKTQRLGIDDTATIKLPNGNTARVMPMSVDASGVLLAVDIEGAVKVDAKAKSGHLLVFGAGRHAGGRLVVSIEPRF